VVENNVQERIKVDSTQPNVAHGSLYKFRLSPSVNTTVSFASEKVLVYLVENMVVGVSPFHVGPVMVVSPFIRQNCRTDKTKKRRFAFIPIRVNNRVPAKRSHKQAFF
jgi:hypothetical protein